MKFDRKDVSISTESSNGGKGSSKFARELRITSCIITLSHDLTGMEVEGDIPPGHYSKKTMQRLREEKINELMLELEEKVKGYNNGKSKNRTQG